MLLPILKQPHPFLRGQSQRVDSILSDETQTLINNMQETMVAAEGIGLAGRQVGRDENIFLINNHGRIMVFVNPRIIYRSRQRQVGEEGCLSIPGVYGLVERSKAVIVKYHDELGQLRLRRFKDLPAVVVQHEYDHNRGVLFIDKVLEYTAGEDLIAEEK
ncbi:MAG: peptide deformylase [Candidatus Komeilibacteria bacterium]|nr:peptide deformylase [Candidatus Komeilibacteria bacterium]